MDLWPRGPNRTDTKNGDWEAQISGESKNAIEIGSGL